MGNLAKKIRDNQDKEFILRKTGKMPKHRCPDCHRFTLWINNGNYKNQCLWCIAIAKEKENKN